MTTLAALAVLLALSGPATAFTRAPVPGAVDPAITQANVHATVCRLGYIKAVRPSEEWSRALKRRLLIEQHLPGKIQDYELDHLIPLGIGGAPRDLANLWLQTWPEARARTTTRPRCTMPCAPAGSHWSRHSGASWNSGGRDLEADAERYAGHPRGRLTNSSSWCSGRRGYFFPSHSRCSCGLNHR